MTLDCTALKRFLQQKVFIVKNCPALSNAYIIAQFTQYIQYSLDRSKLAWEVQFVAPKYGAAVVFEKGDKYGKVTIVNL